MLIYSFRLHVAISQVLGVADYTISCGNIFTPCYKSSRRCAMYCAQDPTAPKIHFPAPSSSLCLVNCPFVPQGAIAVHNAIILTEGTIVFGGNRAKAGAGGGVYCSLSVASFNGSVFTANEAIWGGGRCQGYSRSFVGLMPSLFGRSNGAYAISFVQTKL